MSLDDLPDLDPRRARGWVPSPSFPPILIPPESLRDRVWMGPVSGFEIRGPDVFVFENGQRRRAGRAEALRIRQDMIYAVGPDFARAAGLEPE